MLNNLLHRFDFLWRTRRSSSKIDELLSNRQKFNEFVYTPLNIAVTELQERQKDPRLIKLIEELLPAGKPSILNGGKYCFLSRSLATPNFETQKFIETVRSMPDFLAVLWEYTEDKFTPYANESKHALGKNTFFCGTGKKGGEKIERYNIIDFNLWHSCSLSAIKTKWGQKLVDFHHELLSQANLSNEPLVFDASDWYSKSGKNVEKYYEYIFMLFVAHAINFDNFMIENIHEKEFLRRVFLPAFIKVISVTGKKPLIVQLIPTETEGDRYWTYYPSELMPYAKEKINSATMNKL